MYREIFKTLKSREEEFDAALAAERSKADSMVAEAEKTCRVRTEVKIRELKLACAAALENEKTAAASKLSQSASLYETSLKKKFSDTDEIAERIASILLARVIG